MNPDQPAAPPLKRVAVFNDTRWEKHCGCQLVMRHLLQGLAAHGMEAPWLWPVGRDWRPHRAELRAAPKVDAVVVNAEGSIHHTASNERARYVAQTGQFAVEELRVPAFLINGTLEELDAEAIGHLRHYQKVFLRDKASVGLGRAPGSKAAGAPDLTLYDAASVERGGGAGASAPGVGVTDSVFTEVTAQLKDLAARRGWEFQSMLEASGGGPGEKVRQLQGMPVEQLLAAARELREDGAVEGFLSFLARQSLVLTGRYHTATMCLLTGTPFLALESNTKKISWLLRDVFQDASRLITLEQALALEKGIQRAWTPRERGQIAAYRVAAGTRIRAMFAEIRAGIEAAPQDV